MLEFVLYILSGFGYALYYDLNLLEAALVAVVILCVYRGWTPKFRVVRAWRCVCKAGPSAEDGRRGGFLFIAGSTRGAVAGASRSSSGSDG